MAKPLVAIDAFWISPSCRGMGRHALRLILPVVHCVLGLAPRSFRSSYFRTINSGPSFFPFWEQIWLPFLCRRLNVDILICPYNTAPLLLAHNTKLVLVVHDLIFLSSWREIPPSFNLRHELGRIYRKYLLPLVIRRAFKIITVSQYSKHRIAQEFSLDPGNITVIPNAVEPEWFSRQPVSYSLRAPYILTVSGEAPSKNLTNLILAISSLRQQLSFDGTFPYLRVVGVKQRYHSHFRALAKSVGVEDYIYFESYVDQEVLIELYRNSKLFVFSSLAEGFGIPLVEAMATGCPIACSHTTSLPEVVAKCCFYFNPYKVSSIAQAILDALSSPTVCEQNIACGLTRARLFTTDRLYEKTTAFWSSIF